MKRTLVLLLLVLLGVLWVYWMEVREDTRIHDTRESELVSKTLVGATKREIKGFTLEAVGGEPIEIALVGDEWLMRKPVAARVDEGSVNEVIYDLEFIEKQKTIPEDQLTDELLKSYGLAEPRGHIRVKTILAQKSFAIGGENPGGKMVYVRQDSSGPVYLVKKAFAQNLEKTVLDMRSKMVISLAPAQVRLVKIFGISKAELRKDEDYWNITEPFKDHGDAEAVNSLLKKAARLKVFSFVAEAPEDYSRYGLPRPESPEAQEGSYLTVGEGTGVGALTTVHFGKEAPGDGDSARLVYALVKGEPTVFTLPADEVEALFVSVEKLQSKKAVRFDPYALRKVTISHGLEQVELARRDFDWYIVKPFEAPADSAAVGDLLDAFKNARIQKYVTPEPVKERYGLDVPTGSFSFVQGEKRAVSIMFGSDADETGVYAMRSDTPGVLKVSKALFKKIETPALSFHTRTMQKIDMTAVDFFSVTRGRKTWRLEPKSASGGRDWYLVEPARAPGNPLVTSRIVMNLATTTAAELVERDPVQLALYGLDDPQIVVRVTVSGDGEKPRALLVGKRAENGQHYAMLEGGGIVFTISKGFAMSLKRELRDTMVLLFSRAQASRVEFSAGDAAFAVARDAGEWKVESPEGGSVRTAAIEDELIGLSRLRTERFVRYETAALEEYGLLKPRAVVRIETPSGIAALSIGDVAPSGHYYGASTTVEGVFLINPGDVINVMDTARLFTLAAERPAVEGEAPAEEPAVKGEAPAEAPSSGG